MKNNQKTVDLVKEIDLDGLDQEDRAEALVKLGALRKSLNSVSGNASMLKSLSQCSSKHLKPALLRKEAEELVSNANALLEAIDELPIAS